MSPRIGALLDAALEHYLELAHPRAVLPASRPWNSPACIAGEGHNAGDAPLDAIYPHADDLSLMAATVGLRLSAFVRELFDRHDIALGCMLDAVGSASAERLAVLLAARVAKALADPATRVLAYSPGYCGWHVSGQRALFRYLQPDDVGITLNSSCLMQPLKSVSGVLVAGPAGIHQFRPTFDFCDTCQDKACRDRIAWATRALIQETLT